MALIGLLGRRGHVRGRIADLERAAALGEQLVAARPADGAAYLLRAGTRATFHRFREARADLAAAARRGARGAALAAAAATLDQAEGRLDEALAARARLARERPSLAALAAEAAVLGERGDLAAAERRFAAARRAPADVSPFPVAWLELQQGLLWQRQGRAAHARPCFAAAVARVPGYAPAVSHLAAVEAALGARARAIALLRPLAAASDDPAYAGELAALLRADGAGAEAARLAAQARARYATLLARHPAAFADHAARFYLAAGDDAARALALARLNLAARPTAEAHELVITAALAAGAPDAACAAAARALAARRALGLSLTAARAFAACGRRAEAAAALATAQRLADEAR
jgi:hypothetical protein